MSIEGEFKDGYESPSAAMGDKMKIPGVSSDYGVENRTPQGQLSKVSQPIPSAGSSGSNPHSPLGSGGGAPPMKR